MTKTKKILCFIAALAIIFAVFYVDRITIHRLPITLLCLIPISLISYFCGVGYGSIIAALSLFLWVTVSNPETRSGEVITPYWNAFLLRLFLLISVIFLIKFMLSYKKERHEAIRDYLTDLFNRRHLYELMKSEMDRCRRYKRPFTVVFLDCDNFKPLNDRRGHQGGDSALRLVAKTLKSSIRATDTVARFGGDEFAILMVETDDLGAKIFIDRLKERMLTVMLQNNVPLTFSFGVATYFVPPPTIDDVMKRVDALMYSAKHAGKNMIQYAVYGKSYEADSAHSP